MPFFQHFSKFDAYILELKKIIVERTKQQNDFVMTIRRRIRELEQQRENFKEYIDVIDVVWAQHPKLLLPSATMPGKLEFGRETLVWFPQHFCSYIAQALRWN